MASPTGATDDNSIEVSFKPDRSSSLTTNEANHKDEETVALQDEIRDDRCTEDGDSRQTEEDTREVKGQENVGSNGDLQNQVTKEHLNINGDAKVASDGHCEEETEIPVLQDEKELFDYSDYKRSGPSRYLKSLSMLIPFRPKPKDKTGYAPMAHTGLLAYITMSWMTPFFRRAYKRGLNQEDLRKMAPTERGYNNGKRFHRLWEEEVEKRGRDGASLGKTAIRFVATRQTLSVLFLMLFIMCAFINSVSRSFHKFNFFL